MKILQYGLILLFSVTLWGCGKGNSSSVALDPNTGKHAAGWAVGGVGGAHVAAFFASSPVGASCEACHGKTDDLVGGISKVSCSTVSRSGMTCHPGAWPHGTGFAVPITHGTQVVNKGLALCQKCHGYDYKGIQGLGVSCIACHQLANPANNAPHAFDWTASDLKHSATNPIFAPTCGECHLGGLMRTTPVPLPAGIPTPTCLGTTALCHAEAGHPIPYLSPALHGVQARTKGLKYCGNCHATGTPPRFTVAKNGNLTPDGCENCHIGDTVLNDGTGLAHPYGWLPGRGGSNTTTHAIANFVATTGDPATSCSPCHALTGTGASPSPNAPSCMTTTARIGGTTFCHFTAGPVANPVGCRSCHGTTTTNGQPDGITTAYPNRDYRHSKHFAKLPGLTCGVCHLGKGTGQTDHSTVDLSVATNTAKVVIPGLLASPSFSQTAQGTFNGALGTCANVSCHGGKALVGVTFKWRGASQLSTDVGYCTSRCHTISTFTPDSYAGAYIGPFSGYTSVISGGSLNLHLYHMSGYTCTSCHDSNLIHTRMLQGTRSIKVAGFAKSSLKTAVITSYDTTTTPGKSTCVATCHSNPSLPVVRSWYK